jgi:hypothetical protein
VTTVASQHITRIVANQDLRDAVATATEFDHVLTLPTYLPLLLLCHDHQFFDIPVLQAQAVMLCGLADSACLALTFSAGSYLSFDRFRVDPLSAVGIAAVRPVRGVELFLFLQETDMELLREENYNGAVL